MRHGNRAPCTVMERRQGNQHLLSVTEKVSRKASWKLRGAQRHGKASWKAILVERHGKAVMECVIETTRRVASWKGVTGNQHLLSVTEKVSWNASRKLRGAQRHGKALWKAIPVERHGKAVTECIMESMTQAASRKGVTESVMTTARCAASWKGVMESDTGGASWKSRHGMCHGNREACSVMERRHGNQP